jgi:hypothetical protein
MAEHLSGIAAGLDSIMPGLEGPNKRQVLLATMFLRRLARRAGRFDRVLRDDTYDLRDCLGELLRLLEAEADGGGKIADFRQAWRGVAVPIDLGTNLRDCPSSEYFIARNLELQTLLVEMQDHIASLSDGRRKEQLTLLLRAFHERTMARDLALLADDVPAAQEKPGRGADIE